MVVPPPPAVIAFPSDLLSPAFQDSLLREDSADFITRQRIEAAQGNDALRHYFEAGFVHG